MSDDVPFEGHVHTFVAEALGRIGIDAAAIETSEDERSTTVICENGNVYRVSLSIRVDQIPATEGTE